MSTAGSVYHGVLVLLLVVVLPPPPHPRVVTGSTSLQQSSKGSCRIHMSGYNPNSGANVAIVSVQTLPVPAYSAGGGPRVVVSTAAFHARARGSVPGLGGLKETKMFLPHPCGIVDIVGSLRDREVACSASDHQESNFESCVWRTVSSQSSHHPQVLLAQFSLYVHKGGLKPDSLHFCLQCYP